MPRVTWPLQHGRPCVQIEIPLLVDGRTISRVLLADTGAGSQTGGFDFILDNNDCLRCGGLLGASLTLRGAYVGSFPVYDLAVQLPALGFAHRMRVVGVPSVSSGFDGIASFAFLNRFTYGNFGNPTEFGLER